MIERALSVTAAAVVLLWMARYPEQPVAIIQAVFAAWSHMANALGQLHPFGAGAHASGTVGH